MRWRARLAVSPTGEANSIRQGDGQRFQKKVMTKMNSKIEATAPASVRPSVSVSKISAAKEKAFAAHCANRQLTTEKVLDLLQQKFPRQFELAEIVGRWIWLEAGKSHAATLWKLGFHWNHRRAVWQHPCGTFAPFAVHTGDPRSKYGSRFAADIKPA